jgi:hypothetical protein
MVAQELEKQRKVEEELRKKEAEHPSRGINTRRGQHKP